MSMGTELNRYTNQNAENRYKYNSKELTSDFDLNWSDYGARWYDASIGRFSGVDPLPEKYSFQSPYAYATNYPVLFRDILGMGVTNEYVRDFEIGELTQVGNKGGDETDYIYSGKIHKDENGNVSHVAYSETDAEVFSVGIVFAPDLAIGSEWSTERVSGAIIQHTSGSDAIQFVDDPFTMKASGVMKYLGGKMLAYSVETAAAEGSSKILNFTTKQFQAKFKHAADFGVKGNWNKAAAGKFNSAINQHINSSGVRAIQGTYRGNPVTYYLNPNSGLNVISGPNGQFISGWKLNPGQLQNVLKHGGL